MIAAERSGLRALHAVLPKENPAFLMDSQARRPQIGPATAKQCDSRNRG